MELAESDFRYIWVIRHGKSADGAPGMQDHERPLNTRGVRDGARMRDWFSSQTHQAQWVWCSSAVRARQTAEFVVDGFSANLVEEPDLYLASAEHVLDCLRSTPDEVSGVAVVAHNPGLTHLVNLLGPSPQLDNLVTFGTALFRTHINWSDLKFQDCELVSLHKPKTL